jgi:hypothetical protein
MYFIVDIIGDVMRSSKVNRRLVVLTISSVLKVLLRLSEGSRVCGTLLARMLVDHLID